MQRTGPGSGNLTAPPRERGSSRASRRPGRTRSSASSRAPAAPSTSSPAAGSGGRTAPWPGRGRSGTPAGRPSTRPIYSWRWAARSTCTHSAKRPRAYGDRTAPRPERGSSTDAARPCSPSGTRFSSKASTTPPMGCGRPTARRRGRGSLRASVRESPRFSTTARPTRDSPKWAPRSSSSPTTTTTDWSSGRRTAPTRAPSSSRTSTNHRASSTTRIPPTSPTWPAPCSSPRMTASTGRSSGARTGLRPARSSCAT